MHPAVRSVAGDILEICLPVRIWFGSSLADKLHLQRQGESILLGKPCFNVPMIRLLHRPAWRLARGLWATYKLSSAWCWCRRDIMR
jgi:hypothetical protein